MDNSEKETMPNIGTIVAILLFVGMFIYLTIEMGMNVRMENDLTKEKLKSELLLSEKLSGQKENIQLMEDINEMHEKNKVANGNLKTNLDQLAQNEVELNKAKSGIDLKLIQNQKKEIKELIERIRKDSLIMQRNFHR